VLIAQIAFFPDRTLEWVLASLGAALFLFLPLLVFPTGMGMGDVKLAALLGAALGKSVVPAILAGLLAGAAFSIFLLVREGISARKKTFAYGPFLAFGGVLVLLLGGR
jgi:leader peptidase (prepilin peptidase)/N-methyltransferase